MGAGILVKNCNRGAARTSVPAISRTPFCGIDCAMTTMYDAANAANPTA
jgi:hypothetical protein